MHFLFASDQCLISSTVLFVFIPQDTVLPVTKGFFHRVSGFPVYPGFCMFLPVYAGIFLSLILLQDLKNASSFCFIYVYICFLTSSIR